MRKADPAVEPIIASLRAIGVSAPYASQLARGLRRPSRAMAIRIFRETGRKMGCLEDASDAEIHVLSRFEDQAA